MAEPGQIDVYLEEGGRRTFAGAVEWPGWCRSGRGEEAALQALLEYAPRYAQVLEAAGIVFAAPDDVSTLTVIERLEGSATTDFGSPGGAPAADSRPVDEADVDHFSALLDACWQALDAAAEAAEGHALQKGPRGGGRELAAIVDHVREANAAYLKKLGAKFKFDKDADPAAERARLRQAIRNRLAASARGEFSSEGPRGGKRWTPRYFVRRAAWHILDHAWEIEDRII